MPRNAGAWLTTVAKRKAIDHWRRQENLDNKYAAMARELETQVRPEAWDPDRIDDDVLRLVFISAHPVLSREGQIALTLRVVGGLTTEEIARAFLTSTATIAARITRAKKTLSDANVPFEVPDRSEYPKRLSAVLSVIYLIYNEGYSASFGQRWIRDELCSEALRLGRVLAALVSDEPEVHGLVSLMEFQSSRFAARTDSDGRPILLEAQNRTKWDRAQIQRGVAALERSADALQRKGSRLGSICAAGRDRRMPRHRTHRCGHRLEAHRDALRRAGAGGARRRWSNSTGRSRWRWPSGPAAALEIVDGLTGLDGSYLLPSVRGELLARLGRDTEAADEFDRAAAMTDNEREREVLADKAARARVRRPARPFGWPPTVGEPVSNTSTATSASRYPPR